MSEYIYILFNSANGGYSMNHEFLIELFKKFPSNTDIGKKIFNMEKKENINHQDENDLDIEYFMHYKITDKYIIDTTNNEYYYIDKYCTHLRNNQDIINYIFERAYSNIIENNEFTPYFYNALVQFEKNTYLKEVSTEYAESNFIELNYVSRTDIYNFIPIKIMNHRRRRHIIDNNINRIPSNIYFYKNGFKENDIYYEFTFDININKNTLYEILSPISNCGLLEYILFNDINSYGSSLSIEKINKAYDWKISEYDGIESVIISLPYKNIITDLLNHIWKTENYQNKTIFAEQLINKSHTLSDLYNKNT